MHLRRIAAGAALVVAFGSLDNGVAFAGPATVTTIYVDNANRNCSDSGTGTAAVPFCTIQAAANAAEPGQTVMVSPNANVLDPRSFADYSEDVTITRSGTPGDPITFTTGSPWQGSAWGDSSLAMVYIQPSGSQPLTDGFTLSGVHDVVINGFGVYGTTNDGVAITDSSDITVNQVQLGSDGPQFTDPNGTPPQVGINVAGSGSGVTISRDGLDGTASAVQIGSGVSDAEVTTNQFEENTGSEVSVTGATGTDITSNSWDNADCQPVVAVSGSSTKTTIENNTINGVCTDASAPAEISVAADSTSGTKLDYNMPYRSNSTPLYSWGGTSYSSPADLNAATGQGAHDIDATAVNTDPSTWEPITPAAINSADADAPGELSTDIDGFPRIYDPLVPVTGTGSGDYDRGAYEVLDPLALYPGDMDPFLSASQMPVGSTVTAEIKPQDDVWSSDLTESIDFGDGSAPVTPVNGSATHTYSAIGTYTVTASVSDAYGGKSTSTETLDVVAAAPLLPQISAAQYGADTVDLTDSYTDAWSMATISVDFGDGLPVQPGDPHGGEMIYTYSRPGTYTIKATFTDAAGNTKTVQTQFTTGGSYFSPFGPARLLDTRDGTGTGGKVAQVPANGTVKLKIAGNDGIPSGVTAVAVNLTATNTSGSGFVTGYADGSTIPNVSNLNYTAGKTVPNAAIVPVGADGYIDLTNQGTLAGPIDLLADVTGYFTTTAPNGYTAVDPARLLDTRNGSGQGQVAPNKPTALTIAGADGGALPATGITAVALNVTTTDTQGSGFVSAYPDGAATPISSNLNFTAGQTVANAVIVPVGPDGKIDLLDQGTLAGNIDLIADVTGYFSGSGQSAYVPITPVRALDTRTADPLGPNASAKVNLNAFIPGSSVNDPQQPVTGFVVNTTVTEPTGTGFIAAYPDGTTPPNVSTLNYTPGLTIANLALVTPGNDDFDSRQTVDFENEGTLAGTTELIVDMFGYFSQT
jgi:PKD repeat protein